MSQNSGITLKADYQKSYISEDNLIAAIEKLGFSDLSHYRVRTEGGRWTAIFSDPDANPVIFAGFIWAR